MSKTTSTGRAGRGFLWLTAAKLHFMLAGWAIYAYLPHKLSQVQFGQLMIVIGLVSIANNVMVQSAVQATSRFTAAMPHAIGAALRSGLGIFLLVGGTATALLLLGADALSWLWSDVALAPLFRIAAPIALAYALYAVCVGSLNGRKRFALQAGFDASYATLRLGAMILGAVLVGSSWGVLAGYSAGAAIICGVGLILVGRFALTDRRREPGLTRSMVLFVLPLALHQIFVNLLLRSDLFLIKALGGHVADAGTSKAALTSVLSAHYAAAQQFAFLPYQALIALSMVVFPLVADAAAAQHTDRMRDTATGALRFALLFGAGLAAVLAAQPAGIIDVVYPEAYRTGGPALRFLAWGILGLSLITLGCAMLNAAGKTLRVVLITVVTWIGQAAAVVFAVRFASTPAEVLQYTAAASAVALLAGGVASVGVVWLTFGARPSGRTVVRTVLAAAIATVAGAQLPDRSMVLTVGNCFLILGLFVLVLVVTGEVGRKDLDSVKKQLLRR
jgi:O-antigen/teichoic acid export membrane protein